MNREAFNKIDTVAIQEQFPIDCNCPKEKCKRWGDCVACKSYHGRKGRLPYCKREKEIEKNGGKRN